MTAEVYDRELVKLLTMVVYHCSKEHTHAPRSDRSFANPFDPDVEPKLHPLCDDCEAVVRSIMSGVERCPHDPKPKCRKCPAPCHDKQIWKSTAKIMRYSGLRLGLIKVREKVGFTSPQRGCSDG